MRAPVIHRWAVAVVLHGIWDALIFPKAELLVDGVLLLVGWYILFAIFKQAIAEVAAAKRGAEGAEGSDSAVS